VDVEVDGARDVGPPALAWLEAPAVTHIVNDHVHVAVAVNATTTLTLTLTLTRGWSIEAPAVTHARNDRAEKDTGPLRGPCCSFRWRAPGRDSRRGIR
jgi:hypothetical protein